MRALFLLFFAVLSTGLMAQEKPLTFKSDGAVFSGDTSIFKENKRIVEFKGNAHFSADIVEIDKADKIVFDRKTKTFTISGFSEILLNGKKKLASDLGSTTLRLDLGDSIVYLVVNSKACPGGKGKGC